MKKYNGKVAIWYNPEEDALELWVKGNEEKEWGFCQSTKFRMCRDYDLEALFIHHTLLQTIDRWIKWNKYEFIGYIENPQREA